MTQHQADGVSEAIVERVAKAIALDEWPESTWENDAEFSELEREDYRGHARAAIEALDPVLAENERLRDLIERMRLWRGIADNPSRLKAIDAALSRSERKGAGNG